MSNKFWAAIAACLMVVGAVLVMLPDPVVDPIPDPIVDPVVVVTDPLSVAHKAIRVAEVRMLRDLATRVFASDQAKMDWINSQRAEISKSCNAPYTDAIAEAIIAGSIEGLANQIEGK